MIANNLIFFVMWWIFFRQFKDIGGWNFKDLTALMAIGTGAYGLMTICFGGVKSISRLITTGELDPFLTKPKNPLIHIVASKSQIKGWGHLMTAVILFFFGGFASWLNAFLFSISIISGALVFASFGVIVYSLPFWMGPVDSLVKRYFDSLYVFAVYPTNIYSGIMQLVMFTVIPAGVIGYLPVELVREFTYEKLGLLVFSALIFVGLAFFIFHQGIRKYESGNQFG